MRENLVILIISKGDFFKGDISFETLLFFSTWIGVSRREKILIEEAFALEKSSRIIPSLVKGQRNLWVRKMRTL